MKKGILTIIMSAIIILSVGCASKTKVFMGPVELVHTSKLSGPDGKDSLGKYETVTELRKTDKDMVVGISSVTGTKDEVLSEEDE